MLGWLMLYHLAAIAMLLWLLLKVLAIGLVLALVIVFCKHFVRIYSGLP
jgi:ABC-type arginine/histidine transport system permease subunit